MRLLFSILLLLIFPLTSFAAQLAEDGRQPVVVGSGVESVDLGLELRRGVEASVQLEPLPLLDLSEPLAGNLRHFLIKVVFIERASRKLLLAGEVAARSFASDDRNMMTVRLKPQQSHWSGTLHLPLTEETLIKVGSKLADQKKRIYRFFFSPQP